MIETPGYQILRIARQIGDARFVAFLLALSLVSTSSAANSQGIQILANSELSALLSLQQREALQTRLPSLLERSDNVDRLPVGGATEPQPLYLSTGAAYRVGELGCRSVQLELTGTTGELLRHPFEMCRHASGWQVDNRFDRIIQPSDVALLQQQVKGMSEQEGVQTGRWTNLGSGNSLELLLEPMQVYNGRRCRLAAISIEPPTGDSARGHYRLCHDGENWRLTP